MKNDLPFFEIFSVGAPSVNIAKAGNGSEGDLVGSDADVGAVFFVEICDKEMRFTGEEDVAEVSLQGRYQY